MNKELIMKSDVLDIIFEKRNKAYGAYNLRKFYNNRLIKSLGLMFVAVTILCAFTFLPKKQTYSATDYRIPDDPTLGQVEKKAKTPEPKPKPIVPEVKPVETLKFTSKIIIVQHVDSTDKLHDIVQQTIGSTTIKTPGSDVPAIFIPDPPTTPGGGGESATPVKPVVDKTQPLYSAEIMPEFPGGMDALHRFLQRNLTNPQDIEEGNMVSVKVQFVVGYDGKLQRFHIIEDGGTAFNNEVMRVLKKMPEWKPGKSNGENVSVYYTIPVKFVPSE